MPSPSFTWPRAILPDSVSPLMGPGAYVSFGQSGRPQSRGTSAVGNVWTEAYGPFDPRSVDGRLLLSRIRQAWRNGLVFTIDHLLHATPTGGGSGSPTVNGASQVGASLVTANWTGSNPVLRAGDVIRVAGMTFVQHVVTDAPNLSGGGTTLTLDPPFLAGASPSNGAAIAYSGVTLQAMLADMPRLPPAKDGAYLLDGLTLTFVEAP